MHARNCASTLFGALVLVALPHRAAAADDRVYLSKVDIERSLVGKGLLSKNLASGMVSHWEFLPDGSVRFVNRSGPGSAAGTWAIRGDGLMCVTMLMRTGCRYWFRRGTSFANASSRESDAPTVAEIEFE